LIVIKKLRRIKIIDVKNVGYKKKKGYQMKRKENVKVAGILRKMININIVINVNTEI